MLLRAAADASCLLFPQAACSMPEASGCTTRHLCYGLTPLLLCLQSAEALAGWQELLTGCDLVFVHAPSSNW